MFVNYSLLLLIVIKCCFIYCTSTYCMDFPCDAMVKNMPDNTGNEGLISGSGRSLEKGMATQSSILAWEIPWTEEPGGQQTMVLQKSQTGLSD